MKVVFAERDKMFCLIGEALAPSPEGPKFLAEFFLTECAGPAAMLRAWSARRGVPHGIEVALCGGPQDLEEHLPTATVFVTENRPLAAHELDMARNLRLIQGFGRRLPKIDCAACVSRGIAVRALDRHSNRLVAEHVIMLMLAMTRDLDRSREALLRDCALPASAWAYNWPACKGVKGLAGRTVGLVGLGHVGVLVAEYLRPFGATVLYTRRTRDRDLEAELGIEFVSLDELVSRSDIMSIHVPGNAQTRHLLDADLLARAKPSLLMINTARGSIIDETALIEVLESGRIGGAALDVFASEPLPMDHPLRRAPNTILTPHIAAGTRDEAWLDREIGPVVDSVLSLL